MDLKTTFQETISQAINTEIEKMRGTWVPIAAANTAKFARIFYNLCDDLKKIRPESVRTLFGDTNLHAKMEDVVLKTREAVDTLKYGDTRGRVSQIEKECIDGVERDIISNPSLQKEMISYLCGTLLSDGVLEKLDVLQRELRSFVDKLPLGTHITLINNMIDSIGKFVEVARGASNAASAEKFYSNPSGFDLPTIQDLTNRMKEEISQSPHVAPEKKAALNEIIAKLDSEYPFAGEFAEFENATMRLAREMHKLVLMQPFYIGPVNNALYEVVNTLVNLDDEYYPATQ